MEGSTSTRLRLKPADSDEAIALQREQIRGALLQTWPDDHGVVPVPFSSAALTTWLEDEDAEDLSPALLFEVLQVCG
jgi:hypothetical protein